MIERDSGSAYYNDCDARTLRSYITAAEIPYWLNKNDGRCRVVELRQLVKNWASYSNQRSDMIEDEPECYRWWHRFTSRQNDIARIAAVVHAMCDRDGADIPAWVWKHRATKPTAIVVGLDLTTKYGQMIRASAPSACEFHRVYFDQTMVQSHIVHGFVEVGTPANF